MALKIGILETGKTPPELSDKHKPYGEMFVDLLGAADSALAFECYKVIDNEFPSSIDVCDGWVITGSRHGAYEKLPWMLRLQDFLQDCAVAQKKVVGICFGHQILAMALGGSVEKSDRGWGIGPQTYQLENAPSWADDPNGCFTINAMHQDQVVKLPKNAQVIASSEFCPFAGLTYGSWAISFQAHPEFSDTYEAALIKLRGKTLFSDEVSKPALEGLASDALSNEGPRVANWMINFINGLP
jgi:GMP synthase-like glutamine amidotransferase